MLSDVIDISFKVPLGGDVVRTLLRGLIIRLQQKIPHLLQINLMEPVIDTIRVHTAIEIVRIRADIIRVVPLEIRVVPTEIRVVIHVDPVVAIPRVVRTLRRRRIPDSVPEVYVRISVVVYVRAYAAVVVAWRRRDRVYSWSVNTWSGCAVL